MEIRQLTTFKTILDTGSFTKAAKTLGYTQSTVSAQVKALEQELSGSLFKYERRQLFLTDTGKRLRPLADQLLADFQQVKHLTDQSSVAGTLRIAAPESLTVTHLPTIIQNFRQQYPDVDLQIANATCSYNQQRLQDGEADIAFMMWPSLTTTALVEHDLGEQSLTLVTAADKHKTFAQLISERHEPFIINEPDCSYRNQFERSLWGDFHRRPQIMELWSIAAIKEMVESGIGYSYLPTATITKELQNGQLVAIDSPIHNEIHAHMLTHKQARQQTLIDAFVNVTLSNWRN
ncbi:MULTISPECIES: LysR family transcriptional regulator [Furfurilactobacillus]|uniref:LysR family transcriptional regulator n=2 Tax=Furfurilactobacillus TaxID=2767882 RepID=A0ABT6D9L3_9LACO|nr:LysR family transcriptional regulator [Furfurilactobacillus milii]QLE65517.1 regulatory protein [Furfurilactobacillus rossiae]MCF6161213.1 LysR family transcriptional regulator [Furfurilactobacillus milii]MCF6163532.1 LysR family transcriptional regulator [Furfurilactobacillus milii]MDF9913819.1 LysR family transcriptional regulator [Furfurilactobacillus milii]MYV06355.1 LysR family transcriptional regulator [Furfurilactobacillus milii]